MTRNILTDAQTRVSARLRSNRDLIYKKKKKGKMRTHPKNYSKPARRTSETFAINSNYFAVSGNSTFSKSLDRRAPPRDRLRDLGRPNLSPDVARHPRRSTSDPRVRGSGKSELPFGEDEHGTQVNEGKRAGRRHVGRVGGASPGNGAPFLQAAPLKLLGDQKTDSSAVEREDKRAKAGVVAVAFPPSDRSWR